MSWQCKTYTTALVLATLIPLQVSAFGLGDFAKQVAEKVAVNKAAETAATAISGDSEEASTESGFTSPQELAAATPIESNPMPVTLDASYGSNAVFAMRPKIAIAGYNIGAFQTAKVTSSTTREQGASVSMSLQLAGVDEALLTAIAEAAYSDLKSQLTAAGIDVIDAATLLAAPEAKEIKRSSKPVDGKPLRGGIPDKILVVGPKESGVVSSFGLIPKGFNGNVGDQASAALDAIVIYPNLALNFAWTSGGGKSMLKRSVSVDGGTRFSISSISNIHSVYSKDGRFVDASVKLDASEDIGVDDVFASMQLEDSSNNSGAVGITNALGFGMGSRKGSTYTVTADPERYKALALNAAKGFNKALVEQIKSGKGL